MAINMESAKSPSPWPMRIMIAGFVLVTIGIISVFTTMSGFTDYYDPRIVSEHTAERGEINSFTLESGCWVVLVEGDSSDYQVEFNYVEDGTIGDEISTKCNTDYTAQASDADFSVISKLDVDSKSEVSITINCEEQGGCENELYFVNGDEVVFDMITDESFLITCTFCLTGLILIPIGWLINVINRGQQQTVQLIQDPLTITTEQYNEGLMETPQDMLTTDDLYKLVRGELPNDQPDTPDVPSPFSDTDTRVVTPKKSATGGSINKASSYTPESLPADDSWKNWDEG